jgi:transcriptional regulator with XRE-family HTH domain
MLNEKFCSRLRIMRLEKELSQENIAEMLGMSAHGYAKIERGETEVTLVRVEQISKMLQVEVGSLLEISNNSYNNNGNSHFLGSNQGTVSFQFDKLAMEGLLSKMEKYEKEIADLREKAGL